ncbi:permease [Klebsiella pneumoniae]|uniref:Permease n=1 Tax=Klebsiella pneumoniae TaxID=573 RepID=A0A378BFI5_KLEPN|nr:permease [Klebsiella pneumoniae]
MLEKINYALFALLNATPASPQWAIEMAIFIAKDLILIVPLLVVTLWLWGPAQRQMVFKLMLALTISLTVSWAIGHLYPHDRPFVAGVGYNFLHHAADDSFPSDHGTVSFTFALAFLFWHRLWSGALLMAIAAPSPGPVSISACTGRWIWSAAAGRDVRLPWRGADLAYVRPGAIPSAAAAVSSLLLLANPQRLGARLNAAVAAATA